MKTILKNEDLDQMYNNKFSLILTKTKTCSVCGAIKERLEQIENNYPDIPFYEIYIEDFPLFRGQFLIFTVPTVLILNKDKEILRESRFVDVNKIANVLNILGEQ